MSTLIEIWGPSAGREAPRPIRILMAEDDPSIRGCCQQALTRSGYEVHGVANGAQAWKAFQRGEFQLVITDNDMPEMTGMELIQKIRSTGNAVPAVMASGDLTAQAANEDPSLHLDYFLQKPFSLAELVALVDHLLERKAA